MRFVSKIGRVVGGLGVLLASSSGAQDYVSRANALYADIQADQRSDLVILPVIAQMDAPPRGVETIEKASLQPASGSPIWREAKAWAEKPNQQAALKTLGEITAETDYRFAMAFGLPYGVEQLASETGGIDIIGADLHIDLDVGGAPLLAGADLKYLNGVTDLFCLVHVEATRLAADGDVGGALELLADGVFFARQLADRKLAVEMASGIDMMRSCLERLRDVVYIDLRGERHLRDDQGTLAAVIDRLAERNRDDTPGYIGVERMVFPPGDRLAGEQLVEYVLGRVGVNAETFVPTMAYMTARGNPMMLFSQSPRWADAVEPAEFFSRSDGLRVVDSIQRDYEIRWNRRDPHDPMMSQQTAYDQLLAVGEASMAMFRFTMGASAGMLDLWQVIRLEAIGTRHALSLAAYKYAHNQQSPSGSDVRPRWLPKIEPDPLNSEFLRSDPPLRYMIPGRHIRQNTHTVNIVLSGYGNFQKNFRGDEFLLYSVGGDSGDGVAVEIQNTPENIPGADYLIWPPVMSLLRENLMNLGQLR